jgi:hypothetical protein
MPRRSSKRHLYWLAGSLAGLGLGLFLFKLLVLEYPLGREQQSDLWDIEVKASFLADGGPAKLGLYIPKDTRRFQLVDENFVSVGYGLATSRPGPNRQVTWTVRRAKGQEVLFYRATVRALPAATVPEPGDRPEVVKPELTELQQQAMETLVAAVNAESADIDSMVSLLVARLNAVQPSEEVSLLLHEEQGAKARIRVAVKALRFMGIPARLVQGVQLSHSGRHVPLVAWFQVYDGQLWRSFNPETGEGWVPDDYFTWWRGEHPLASLSGGSGLRLEIATVPRTESALRGAGARAAAVAPGLSMISLAELPVDTQLVYRILLMVPLGIFVLVILRNLVGVKTFGTFMPVLIALAFRETQLLWGVTLFCVIVGLGLAIRFYLEHLKLLLVPRLAAVVVIVVMLMTLISLVSQRMGLPQGLSIALFPMVIITMTIERMSIVWEERGAAEALSQAMGSLAVAVIAYLVMNQPHLEHLVFVFPELLLVLLAGILLLGRYSGYRLLELKRFKALAGGH